jgi:hypothetical protein
MRIKRSEEWWLSKAAAEGDVTIAAGAPSQIPMWIWRLRAALSQSIALGCADLAYAQTRKIAHVVRIVTEVSK